MQNIALEKSRDNYERYLKLGIGLSIAFHLGFFWLLQPRSSLKHQEAPLIVNLLPPLDLSRNPPQKLQMVSPPDAPSEAEAPKGKAYLSDQNTSAEKEQIRRGTAQDAGIPLPPAPPKQEQRKSTAKAETATVTKKASSAKQDAQKRKTITQLKLDSQFVRDTFAKPDAPQKTETETVPSLAAPVARKDYEPFSRPSGTGARFLGVPGNTDFLPHLPDGDITLLNTKASRFAVFVRRVATQVFGQLRAEGWGAVSARDIQRMSRDSTVHAVLSPRGELLQVRLEESSGSRRFDDLLVLAAQKGAADPNPPAEAAMGDGNIHFVFKARSWVRYGTSRSGVPREQRWLLLATGLR